MNGATRCTRLLGCSYLHPHVIPDPHVNSVYLSNDDEFVVIANATFWSHVTPDEAVAEIRDIISPVAAAKRLQDLAQVSSYSSSTSIASPSSLPSSSSLSLTSRAYCVQLEI